MWRERPVSGIAAPVHRQFGPSNLGVFASLREKRLKRSRPDAPLTTASLEWTFSERNPTAKTNA
jgi:hypothetical protein